MLWSEGDWKKAIREGNPIAHEDILKRYMEAEVRLKEIQAEAAHKEEIRKSYLAPHEEALKRAQAELAAENVEKQRQLRPFIRDVAQSELAKTAADVAKTRAEAGKIERDVQHTKEHYEAERELARQKLDLARQSASLQALSDMQKSYRAEINKTLSEADTTNPDILRIIAARTPTDAFAGYGKNISTALADIARYRKTGELPDDILTDREREALAKPTNKEAVTPTTAAQPKATTAGQPAVEAKPSLAERFLGATTKWAREDSDQKTKELSAYMQMGGYDDKQISDAIEKYKTSPKQLDVDLNIARQRHKNIEELINLAEIVTGKKLDTATKAAEYRRFWNNPDLIAQYMEELRRRRR